MTLRSKKLLGYGLALAALAAVFALYTRADMMVSVSEMIWACFQ